MSHALRNHISREEALKLLASESEPRRTLSFYRYVALDDPQAFRDELFEAWSDLRVLGRIYVAREGINAQLNVPESNLQRFIAYLNSRAELREMPLKFGVEEGELSFWKLTIKVKEQIVADDLPQGSYDTSNVGNHLTAEEFNRAIESGDSIVVDIRNHYESRIGRFENAICPDADTFREELAMLEKLLKDKRDKKVLLYCTGGIRCEKASSYLKHLGFKDVNQLYGGVINYAHEIRQKRLESKFKGKNFVFDDRLHEKITDDVLSECDQCDVRCDEYANCENEMCNLLFIQCSACTAKMNGCCTERCKEIAALPEKERVELRKKQGKTNYSVFKSRQRPVLK